MKKYVLLALIILFPSVSFSQSSKTEITNIFINCDEFSILLDTYNKVGKASIKFGADTESEWASSQIDSICNTLKKNNFSLNEYITKISLIRSLLAYSISYVPGTFAMHRDTELGQFAWGISNDAKNNYKEIEQGGFNNLHKISQYNIKSLFYFNIYFGLIKLLHEHDYFKHEDHASLMSYMYINIDKLYESTLDSIQAYYNSIIISQSAFYMTFERLIQRTSTKEQFYENKDSLWSFAMWFDQHTMPIQNKIETNDYTTISQVTEDNILDYMKKSSKREVMMLKMLEKSFMNDN